MMPVFRGACLGGLGSLTKFDILVHSLYVTYLCALAHEDTLALLGAKVEVHTSPRGGRPAKSLKFGGIIKDQVGVRILL